MFENLGSDTYRCRLSPNTIVGNDADPGVDPVEKLDSYQTFIPSTKPMLRSIRHELRNNEAQLFTAFAWELTIVGNNLAADAQRL